MNRFGGYEDLYSVYLCSIFMHNLSGFSTEPVDNRLITCVQLPFVHYLSSWSSACLRSKCRKSGFLVKLHTREARISLRGVGYAQSLHNPAGNSERVVNKLCVYLCSPSFCREARVIPDHE